METDVSQQINLSGPDITQAEIDAVVAVLKTPRLSLGPKVLEFEQAVADRIGVRHAVSCNSGTMGLHMIWRSLGIGKGDEVITSPFSFIASSNSVMFDGARPVFVDVDPFTWQIDANLIEPAITSATKALLPVDIFGATPDWDPILDIVKRRKLRVVEDSCEALGTKYKGRPAGSIGEAGCFGFYPNKQTTTGEGGMVVTNSDEIANRARSLRNQGRDPDAGWLAHARLGFNYRMCDINAALGAVQVGRLDEILAKRSRVAEWYRTRLADEQRVTMQGISQDVDISWFVMVVRLSDDYTQDDRDNILRKLDAAGIGCSNYFTPIHLQPFYREELGYKPGQFPVCEALSARTIALPFHNHLTEAEVDTVVKTLKSLL
ncbi:MAG: DegT/DnrJ/EryC1/StrS family aminotransferase [Phycisphaerae bacterium]|nr:DegT/DnrJ/EryC1/StrS family aminotransferase [Phycisphaerae bacterium]